MKSMEIVDLVENDITYKEKIKAAENAYKTAWDDEVHESYAKYLNKISEYSEQLHTLRLQTEKIIEETNKLNIDSIVNKADRLCGEVDSI